MDKALLINRHRMLVGAYDPFSEYQQVEWIQSSGTQYINTGIAVDNNTAVVCEGMFVSFLNQQRLFSTYNGETVMQGTFEMYQNGSGNYAFSQIGGNSWINTGIPVSSYYSTKLKFVWDLFNLKSQIINGATNLYNVTATKFTSFSSNPLLILTRDPNVSPSCPASNTKLYTFKIYKSGNLVRDFIPCYHKTTGVIGLWDKVSKQFFTNSGTGVFTKGSDVN